MATIQTIPFTFQGGLNAGVDELQLEQPQLLAADNITFDQLGKVIKRTGFQPLSKNVGTKSNSIDSGVAIQSFNNELLLFDGNEVFSYIGANQSWLSRGNAFSIVNKQKLITRTKTAEQSNPDATSIGGLECVVYEDSRGGIRYSVIDSTTGAFVISDVSVDRSGYSPKVVAISGQFFIFYMDSIKNMVVKVVTSSHPDILPTIPQILFRDGYGTNAYDIFVHNNAPVIVYASDSGLNIVKTSLSGNTINIVSSSIVDTSTSITCAATTVDSKNIIWVAYAKTSGVYVLGCDYSTLSETILKTEIQAGITCNTITCIEDVNLGSLNITYEVVSSPDNYIYNVLMTTHGIIINKNTNLPYRTLRSVGIASKPFIVGKNVFLNVVFASYYQSTYFTICLTQDMCVVGKINYQTGGTYRTNHIVPQCDLLNGAADNFLFANQKKGSLIVQGGTSFTELGINNSYLSFNSPNAFNSVIASNNLHIVGGIEQVYDSNSVVENNFNTFPEFLSTYQPTINNGAGSVDDGYHSYVFVAEWTDNNGLTQQGQPSLAVDIYITGSPASVRFDVPTIRLTSKTNTRSPISIAAYRTTAIGADVYYKVTSNTDPSKMIINDVTKDTISWLDTSSDASITANDNIYTDSQVYYTAPPSCSLITNYKQRVMLSGMEDPNIIWFSQNKFDLDNYNTAPVQFSPLFTIGTDVTNTTSGPVTAIAKLDDTFIIFKETSIFAISADGPNANASGNQFPVPESVVSDTGCNNANSIVAVPQNNNNAGGLMFKSEKGIYMLERGQSAVTYIGKPVENYNALTITSSEIINDTNEIVFTTLEGTMLVYNYYFGSWYTWSDLPAIDACIWQNQLCLLRTDGTVLVQKDDVYSDYDIREPNQQRQIISTITTPWLKFAGMQGYQAVYNVRILGQYLGPHVLNVKIAYDNNPYNAQELNINGNLAWNLWGGANQNLWGDMDVWGGSAFTPYQFLINFKQPFSQSVRLTISDYQNSTYTQGMSLSHLLFEAAIFPNGFRMPRSNTVG